MITLNYDITTGLAKFATVTPIKAYGVVPMRLVFSAAPGSVSSIKLSLGDNTSTPSVLAYTEDWTEESETVWRAILDATDTRLTAFMVGKQSASVDLELIVTIDGEAQYSPNLSLSVQQPIVYGTGSGGSGGPTYYTDAEVLALIGGFSPAPTQTDINVSAAATAPLFTATNFGRLARTIIAAAGSGSYTAAYALPAASMTGGAMIDLNIEFAASTNPTVEIHNATTGGTLLATTTNPSPGAPAYWYGLFRFDGTAWHKLFSAFQ